MSIIEIQSTDDPRLAPYLSLTEAQLRSRLDSSKSLFIAESPKVIRVAIGSGFIPESMLCERKHISGDAADIIDKFPEMPVFTADRQILASMTGYTLTRGVLCAMRRPTQPEVTEVTDGAKRVAVIDGVVDTTNIGAIFRSAAALGIDAVLLTTTSCDPFNRRAVRVSMGTVFQVPWTWIERPVETLKSFGFTTVAMALREDAITLDKCDELKHEKKLAIFLGTEGDGLSRSVTDNVDKVVMIPMSHGVDSLNVAAASAVAFWALRHE